MLLLSLLAAAAAPPRLPAPGPDSGTISADDYPLEAIRSHWQGDVRVDLTVSPTGRVTQCTVLQSSGHKVLDARTCQIISDRAKFEPAIGESGTPVESHYQTHIDWQLGD